MLADALTTAEGEHATRPSAATRSMSRWSMTAISPGRRRLVRLFVRLSSRAAPFGAEPAELAERLERESRTPSSCQSGSEALVTRRRCRCRIWEFALVLEQKRVNADRRP